MSKNKYRLLQNDFTVSPGESRDWDIDLETVENLQFFFSLTFVATGSATGVDLTIYEGLGASDPLASSDVAGVPVLLDGSLIPTYETEGTTYSLGTFDTDSGDSQTDIEKFNIVIAEVGRWMRLKFTNNDNANDLTIKIYGDL